MARALIVLVAIATLLFAVACSDDDSASGNNDTPQAGETPGRSAAEEVTLRLGYFPNVTHAQPQVALARGTFDELLADNVTLETTTFNAGPAVIEALFAGEIDVSYGPNPAINGYVQSEGTELRIVAGATSGGALLIVRPEANISAPADFANKKVASPHSETHRTLR